MQNPNPNKTQLVSPDGSATKLDKQEKKARTVKIRALRMLRVTDLKTGKSVPVREGEVVEVSEEEAKIFLEPKLGCYAFGGERIKEEAPRHKLVRAELVLESA